MLHLTLIFHHLIQLPSLIIVMLLGSKTQSVCIYFLFLFLFVVIPLFFSRSIYASYTLRKCFLFRPNMRSFCICVFVIHSSSIFSLCSCNPRFYAFIINFFSYFILCLFSFQHFVVCFISLVFLFHPFFPSQAELYFHLSIY